jgi:hypothetical protein
MATAACDAQRASVRHVVCCAWSAARCQFLDTVNIEVHGPELVSFDDTIAAIADAVGCGNSCHVWDTVPCGIP